MILYIYINIYNQNKVCEYQVQNWARGEKAGEKVTLDLLINELSY